MKQFKRWKRAHSSLQGSILERASTSLSPPPSVLSSSPQPGGPLKIKKQHPTRMTGDTVSQHEDPQYTSPSVDGVLHESQIRMLPPFPEHWPIQKSDPTKKDRDWTFKEYEARAEGRLQ